MRQPVTRNVQNNLINPRAGLADINAETQAIASGQQVASALGKGLTNLGIAFDKADSASQYANGWNLYTKWDLAQTDYWKSQKFIKPNPDYEVPGAEFEALRYLPTHPNIVANYATLAQAEITKIAKSITNKDARARFLTNASTKARETGLQLSNFARQKHHQYLQGKVLDHLEGALTRDRVDEILDGDDALLSYGGKDIETLRQRYYKSIAVDTVYAAITERWNSEYQLDSLADRIQDGGLVSYYRDEDDVSQIKIIKEEFDENFEFITEDERIKFLNRIRTRQEQLEKDNETLRKGRLSDQLVTMLEGKDGVPYTLGDLETFAEDEDLSPGEYTQFRNLLEKIQEPVLSPNPQEFGNILDDLDNYSVMDIAGNHNLQVAQKIQLIKERAALDAGGANWRSFSNAWGTGGAEGLQLLKAKYNVLEPSITDMYLSEEAQLKKAQQRAAYAQALAELTIYLGPGGINPETGQEWKDSEKPRAAWDWVMNHINKMAQEPSPSKNETSQTALSKWQMKNPRGTGEPPFTPQIVLKMPASPYRDQLLESMAAAGIDLNIDGAVEGKSLEEWIEDGGSPEEWLEEVQKIIYPNMTRRFQGAELSIPDPITFVDPINTLRTETDIPIVKPDTEEKFQGANLDVPADKETAIVKPNIKEQFQGLDLTIPAVEETAIVEPDTNKRFQGANPPMSTDKETPIVIPNTDKRFQGAEVSMPEKQIEIIEPDKDEIFHAKTEDKEIIINVDNQIKVVTPDSKEDTAWIEPLEHDKQVDALYDILSRVEVPEKIREKDVLPFEEVILYMMESGIDVLKNLIPMYEEEKMEDWKQEFAWAIKLYTEGAYDNR